MSFIVRFRSDLECIGGSTVLAETTNVDSYSGSVAVDHTDSASLVVPQDAYYLATLRQRQVAHITDDLGAVREWRVGGIEDGRAEGRRHTAIIRLKPLIRDLDRLGFIYITRAGKRWYNLGHADGGATVEQSWDTYVAPWLTAEGITWLGKGTIDFGEFYTYAWERFTLLRLIMKWVELTKGEHDLRRNGTTNYLVDLLGARGQSAPNLRATTTRNILNLERQRDDENLYTVIMGAGGVPPGDVEVATRAHARFRVAAIGGGKFTLEDPTGQRDPIEFDDQYNTKYLKKVDGTTTQINDTEVATQQVTPASTAGVAVKDMLEIVANSSGDELHELQNPAAVALFGRIVGTVEESDARGEANEVPNGMASDWGSAWPVYHGQANGVHTATTTLSLKSLPINTPIVVDAQINTANSSPKGARDVTVGGTTDGSGTVVLTISAAITLAADEVVKVWNFARPTGYTKPVTVGSPAQQMLIGRRNPLLATSQDPVVAGNLTGAFNGVHTALFRLSLDGVANNASVNPGDVIEYGAGPAKREIVGPAQANGSGVLVVDVHPSLSVTAADNDPFTIRRHATSIFGQNSIWLPNCFNGGGGSPNANNHHIRTGSRTIKFFTGMPKLRARAGFALLTSNNQVIQIGSSIKPAWLSIYDTGGAASLAHAYDADFTTTAYVVAERSIALEYTVTADKTVALAFGSPGDGTQTPGGAANPYGAQLHYLMLWLGEDANQPVTEFSFANRLHNLINATLAQLSAEPFIMSVRFGDLARLNPNLTEEALAIGQTVDLLATDMAGGQTVSVLVRLMGYTFVGRNPADTILTLQTLSPRFTSAVAKARATKLYVQVTGARTTDQAPTPVTGAIRTQLPEGQVPGSPGSGTIGFQPYDPPVG